MDFSQSTYDALWGRYEYLAGIPDREKRQLTVPETAESNAILDELDKRSRGADPVRKTAGLQLDGSTPRVRQPDNFCYRHPETGRFVASVGAEQSIADCDGSRGALDGEVFGGWLANELLGRPQTSASLQVQRDASGGFLVPEVLSTGVLDYARANQVCTKAGVRTITLPAAKEYQVATITADPTSYFRREGAVITASKPTFGQIIMRPRTLACLVPVTVELLEDALNSADVITQAIAGSIATALDAAVLNGDGASEPVGILEWADVNTRAVGTPFTYDDLIGMQTTIMSANGPDAPEAFILDPTREGYRRQLKDGDGQYMLAGDTPLGSVPFYSTTSCPAGSIVSGAFSEVVQGIRTSMKVEVLNAGTGTDDAGEEFNATTMLGRWVRCYLRCDVAVMRPTWLSILTDARIA